MENTDILLDANGDDAVEGGDFKVGDSRMDDCYTIFKLNSGALKYDPVLAPNLVLLMNSKASPADMKKALALHLERDKQKYKVLEVRNGVIDFEI